MTKSFAKFGAFFAAFGLVFAGIGGFFFIADQRLAATGLRASGEVIALDRRYDDDGGTTYAPVFTFVDASGVRHRIVSSTANSPASFKRGEQVTVIYDPAEPDEAVIDSFGQRFLFPLVFGGIGSVFALIGGWLVARHYRRKSMIAALKARGVRIQADFQQSYLDRSYKVNGRSPFRIVAQATHPATGQLTSFKSDGIWVDLSTELEGRKLPILVDLNRPKRYWIDLTQWLPEEERA